MRQKRVINNVLKSVTESYHKVRKVFITNCDKSVLQSTLGITKCNRLLLRSALGIYKV